MRRHRKKKRKEQLIVYECAWCGETIPEGAPVWSLSGGARPGLDLTGYRGTMMEISVAAADKTIPVMVATEDSELKRTKGHDLLFMLCSQLCGLHLREALAQDLQIDLS